MLDLLPRESGLEWETNGGVWTSDLRREISEDDFVTSEENALAHHEGWRVVGNAGHVAETGLHEPQGLERVNG